MLSSELMRTVKIFSDKICPKMKSRQNAKTNIVRVKRDKNI